MARDLVHGRHRVPLAPGRTLFDAADELAMVVPASCRRSGRCHECVVEILRGEDALSPPDPQEAFLRPGYRLACRATVEREPAASDLEFIVLRRRLKILMPPDGPPLALDPAISVEAGRIRWNGEDVGAARDRLLGIALDVGTTTVVLQVLDLRSGEPVAVGAFENPQRFGGSDVIGRISYEADRPGELRRALRRALNHELARVYAEHGIERHDVLEVVVVGNATMRDLFFGLDVAPIGRSPFRSVTEVAWRAGEAGSSDVTRLAHELGILVHPRARIWGAPLIACHVGADAAADLLPTGMLEAADPATSSGPAMLVDVGTNTEVVITDGRHVLAASCPAGPAFEGGLVRYGMPGSEGAIEAARHDGDGWVVRTIGDVEPEGICGSGLIDILAELRRTGAMTPTAGFSDGTAEIALVPERGITFSRADAAQLAQAKAANAVGMRVLLRALGLAPADLAALHLAGGFASHLDVRNAQAIGFLPPVPADRVVQHGNASVRGAATLLLSRRARTRLDAFVGRIEHVELEAEPDFFDLFVDGLRFDPLSSVMEVSPA
ncbi:MAG: ASKHA domain-containing protein [Chloroflexota bacterium]